VEFSAIVAASRLRRINAARLERIRGKQKYFPHAFALELRVKFSGKNLNTKLVVRNNSDQSLGFTCASDTYLNAQIADAALYCLNGYLYRDSVDGRCIKQAAARQSLTRSLTLTYILSVWKLLPSSIRSSQPACQLERILASGVYAA
jgi:D-hexose-6-phosphate mutarotase